MGKLISKTSLLLIGFFVVLLGTFFLGNQLFQSRQLYQSITSTNTKQQTIPFSYKGREGKNALVLLQEKTTVEKDKSSLVVSVNGRKADSQKREYWAFYVNGKLAPVGPADYQTKDTDVIEWRIEKY